MLWKIRRPNMWIGMVASCLCTLLWGWVLAWYISDGMDYTFPLIATALFSLCSVSEIMLFRKARAAKKQAKEKKNGI